RTSPYAVPLRMDTPTALAEAHRMRARLGLTGGQLVANPIPSDDEIPQSEIDPIIARALARAEDEGILAKDVTPFLLDKIFELTDGRSLVANIALVKNNARLAAAIARALG
ncbi:MAG: pseudouridine-5'-phosphate glycosidase, partial [Pseudomonadota bacterium]